MAPSLLLMAVRLPGPVVGRETELRAIDRLLSERGGLLLEGPPGIGKTTVWRHGLEMASAAGWRVLPAAPAEAEASFSYAVLADLVEPAVDGLVDRLPAPQAHALRRALFLDAGAESASPRALGVAVRSVLRLLASDGPLLVAIDDVQWTDAASVVALNFALRRLSDEGIALLLALRSGWHQPLEVPLERIAVGALSLGAVHRLLVERLAVSLPRRRLLRVHQVSGGNPFYALELVRSATTDDELVFPPSLREAVVSRVERLSPPTRRSLAAAALGGPFPGGEELREATEAGVIESGGDRLRFSHPMLAEAAVTLLGHEERAAVHRELAASAPTSELRAFHLAQSSDTPDGHVAAEIAAGAQAAEDRGALAAAAELWESAARLTPGETLPQRSERLGRAALAMILASDLERGAALLAESLEQLPAGPVRDRCLMHRALIAAVSDVDKAIAGLREALGEITALESRLPVVSALVGFTGLRDPLGAAEVAHAFLAEAEAAGEGTMLAGALTLAAVSELELDRPAWPLIEQARALHGGPLPDTWISADRAYALALSRDGRLSEARAAALTALQEFEEAGEDLWVGLLALQAAAAELALGDLSAALELAERGLEHSRQIATPHMISAALGVRATVLAVLGDVEHARADCAAAIDVGMEAKTSVDPARMCLALLELSSGDVEAAAAVYRDLPVSSFRAAWLVGWRAALDAVQVLAGTGELAAARAIAASLPEDARERPVADAHLAAAEGDLERAISLIAAAVPSPAPLQHARELLVLGTLLRRARRRSEARHTLEAARAEFEQLPAPLWIARCNDELARLGGRAPDRTTLTASERRVAQLAASGLSNKEIAATLVVSPRTVEAHLTSTYSKLGVRSRTALAAVLARNP